MKARTTQWRSSTRRVRGGWSWVARYNRSYHGENILSFLLRISLMICLFYCRWSLQPHSGTHSNPSKKEISRCFRSPRTRHTAVTTCEPLIRVIRPTNKDRWEPIFIVTTSDIHLIKWSLRASEFGNLDQWPLSKKSSGASKEPILQLHVTNQYHRWILKRLCY